MRFHLQRLRTIARVEKPKFTFERKRYCVRKHITILNFQNRCCHAIRVRFERFICISEKKGCAGYFSDVKGVLKGQRGHFERFTVAPKTVFILVHLTLIRSTRLAQQLKLEGFLITSKLWSCHVESSIISSVLGPYNRYQITSQDWSYRPTTW